MDAPIQRDSLTGTLGCGIVSAAFEAFDVDDVNARSSDLSAYLPHPHDSSYLEFYFYSENNVSWHFEKAYQ